MGSMRLWEAIEAAVPLGLREMVRNNIAVRKRLHDTYFDAAHPHILVYAGAAGGAGAIPVPYIDVPVVLAIQAKLFHTIGAIYGQPMNVQQMATIASGLGIGYLARFGVRELAKLIPVPGVGSAISGAFAVASTYGLGIALCEYFGHVLDGNVPDAENVPRLVSRGVRRRQTAVSQASHAPSPEKEHRHDLSHEGRLVVCRGGRADRRPYSIVFAHRQRVDVAARLDLVLGRGHGRAHAGRAAAAGMGAAADLSPGRGAAASAPRLDPRGTGGDAGGAGDFAAIAGPRSAAGPARRAGKGRARRADGSAGNRGPALSSRQADRPVLQAPVAHIAAVVELVARDFRRTFSENVPWGNTVTPGQLLWWKEKGRTRLADRGPICGRSTASGDMCHAARPRRWSRRCRTTWARTWPRNRSAD